LSIAPDRSIEVLPFPTIDPGHAAYSRSCAALPVLLKSSHGDASAQVGLLARGLVTRFDATRPARGQRFEQCNESWQPSKPRRQRSAREG
jgi:hypothetical protein